MVLDDMAHPTSVYDTDGLFIGMVHWMLVEMVIGWSDDRMVLEWRYEIGWAGLVDMLTMPLSP